MIVLILLRLFARVPYFSSLTIGKWTPKSQLVTTTNHFHFLCEHFISEDSLLSPAVARHLFVSVVLTVWRCVIDYSEVNSKLPTWSWHTVFKILFKLTPHGTCAVLSSSLFFHDISLLRQPQEEPKCQLLHLGSLGELMELIWSHLHPTSIPLIVLSLLSSELTWSFKAEKVLKSYQRWPLYRGISQQEKMQGIKAVFLQGYRQNSFSKFIAMVAAKTNFISKALWKSNYCFFPRWYMLKVIVTNI